MDKWEYQNKPCYLEDRVVREPCKQRTADELQRTLVNDKSTGIFRHILVAFSEYMNFIIATIFFGIKLDQTEKKILPHSGSSSLKCISFKGSAISSKSPLEFRIFPIDPKLIISKAGSPLTSFRTPWSVMPKKRKIYIK